MKKYFLYKKKNLIFIIAFFSLAIYLAGVFSGLFANKILEKKINEDVVFLRTYVDSSALDLKNIQLQQLFIENFEDENQCEFLDIYLNHLHTQLSSFWEVLPERLEEYDKNYEPTHEYLALKREYIRLSLRVWLIAKKDYYSCESKEFIPILYFYSKECTECLQQGIEFDKFKEKVAEEEKTAIVFPIDLNFEDDSVFLLKTFYNITSVPAVIINEEITQGEIITSEQISMILDKTEFS